MTRTTIMMTLTIAVVLAGTLLLSIPQNAFAVTNLVSNPSFESGPACPSSQPEFATVFSGDTSITGWTIGGNSVDWICGYWPAQDLVSNIDLSGTNPLDPGYLGTPSDAGLISQDIATITGATYTVTFYMSGNSDNGGTSPDPIKYLTATAPGYSNQFSYDTTGHPSGSDWVLHTFSFTATSITSTLAFTSNTDNPFGPAIDNVAVVLSSCPVGQVLGTTDNSCVTPVLPTPCGDGDKDHGHTGATGQTGHTGHDDDNGHTGATGQTGHTGHDDDNGHTGATGSTGNDDRDHTGATGSTGHDNDCGHTGHTGQTGSTGNDDDKGHDGKTGATGSSGKDNDKGHDGKTGATGSTGKDNDKGQNGNTGNTGSTGKKKDH